MAAKKPWLAVLKAIAMSKAAWKLMSAVAVFFCCAHGELTAGLVGEVIADVSGAL